MVLFYLFVGMVALGLFMYVIQLWAVRSYLTTPYTSGEGLSLPPFFPPISILKPLKGLDDNLFDNLESFCRLDYPDYELIFSLQDHNDPAYKIIKKIKNRHPERKISIIVDESVAGLNPKVSNLIPAYKASQYDYILISDSNVMVDRTYLREIVSHMNDPEVGLVSNLIRGRGGRTLGAVFENLHLNSFIMGSVCFLDRFLKKPCVIGKSMLMRKDDLDRIGGFKGVRDILAEDYVIGERMHQSGKRVVLSNHIIHNVNEYWSLKRFVNRHVRWGKLRWKIGGPTYLFELIGNPVFTALLALIFCGASKVTLALALSVAFIKAIGDFSIGRSAGTELPHPLLYLLSPFKDILIGIVWFIPLLSNTVVWRGNRYTIGKGSVLSPCPSNGLPNLRYRIAGAIRGMLA